MGSDQIVHMMRMDNQNGYLRCLSVANEQHAMQTNNLEFSECGSGRII